MKEGWRNKRIDEITYLITDGDWIESRHQSDDGFRLIQTGNIGRGIFKSKDDKPHFISETTFKELSCTEIFEGDCLISRLPDPVGRSCLIPNIGNRMITAVDCTILRFKKEIIPPFFVYYTQSNRYSKEIEGNVTGATRKRISRKNLEKIQVPIPPLSEQQHVVEELDLLSSIIEKKKAQLNELDNLAQSLFYEMFGDPINNEKGWKEKRLDEVCDVRDGTHDSPKYVIESDYVLITSKNIQDGELSFNNVNYITKEDYDKINVRSYVDDGDIIMAMIGTIGKPIIIKKCGKKFGIKNVALLKFRESHDVINVYVKSMLDNPTYMKYLHSLNRGGTQKFISLKTIRNLPILLPPLYLQNQFASKIEAIEHQKELIKQSIKEVETLFNSRMDYYFN